MRVCYNTWYFSSVLWIRRHGDCTCTEFNKHKRHSRPAYVNFSHVANTAECNEPGATQHATE